VQRIAVPFTVAPRAPSGVQNAPGCTPVCRDGVVGAASFVAGFGFGFGLGFGAAAVAGSAEAGSGLDVVVAGAAAGPVVSEAAAGTVVVTAGSTNAGRAVESALAADVFGSAPKVPRAHNPPQHSTTTARAEVNRMIHGLLLRFGASGGGR
jgi:hypothetical protein